MPKLTIIQCYMYAPTNDAHEEETGNIYEKLQLTLNNTPKRDIKIGMGDLNAKIGNHNKNRERIMGKHIIGEMNENGLKLVEFCEANELVFSHTKTSTKQPGNILMAKLKTK